MSIDWQLLRHFVPVQELDAPSCSRLADKATIIELPPRRRIEDTGLGRWMIYLLKGTLLVNTNGHDEVIDAGTARAQRPVFPLDHAISRISANSRGPVLLLRLDRALFDLLLREQRMSGYEVQDTPLSNPEAVLLNHIYQAVKDGSLELPSMPEVAVRIRDAAMRPEVSAHEIAQIVQIDPIVAVGVLRQANSAALRGARPIDTLAEAVTRLGFEATRSLTIRIAISQVFKADTPLIRQRMHELWEHSVQTSAMASVLARHTTGLSPDHAQLTGLLHDIGGVPILLYAERSSLAGDAAAIETALHNLRAPVGLLVLDYWDLDSDFSKVVQGAESWLRDTFHAFPDPIDLVVVAQRLLEPANAPLPPLAEMSAFARLGLGQPEPQTIAGLLEEAQQQLAEIKELLAPPTAA